MNASFFLDAMEGIDDAYIISAQQRLGSRTDVAVLHGECYQPVDTSRAWICDLETGQVRDVLADCGFDEGSSLAPVLFAEDLKHALVRAWDGVPGSGLTPYLADLEAKTHIPPANTIYASTNFETEIVQIYSTLS